MLREGVGEKKKKEREGKEEGMTCPRRPPNRQGHDDERRAAPCPSLELWKLSLTKRPVREVRVSQKGLNLRGEPNEILALQRHHRGCTFP